MVAPRLPALPAQAAWPGLRPWVASHLLAGPRGRVVLCRGVPWGRDAPWPWPEPAPIHDGAGRADAPGVLAQQRFGGTGAPLAQGISRGRGRGTGTASSALLGCRLTGLPAWKVSVQVACPAPGCLDVARLSPGAGTGHRPPHAGGAAWERLPPPWTALGAWRQPQVLAHPRGYPILSHLPRGLGWSSCPQGAAGSCCWVCWWWAGGCEGHGTGAYPGDPIRVGPWCPRSCEWGGCAKPGVCPLSRCAPFMAAAPDTWGPWPPPLPLPLGDVTPLLLSAPLMSCQRHLLPVYPRSQWQEVAQPSAVPESGHCSLPLGSHKYRLCPGEC